VAVCAGVGGAPPGGGGGRRAVRGEGRRGGWGGGLRARRPGGVPPRAIAEPPPAPPAPLPAAPPRPRTYFAAGIEELYPSPEQPRRRFHEAQLGELADSMKAHGVIVPLGGRPRPRGGYFLIAGRRRWRGAAGCAGAHGPRWGL